MKKDEFFSYFFLLPSEEQDTSSAVPRRYKQDCDFCKENNLRINDMIDLGQYKIGDYWVYMTKWVA